MLDNVGAKVTGIVLNDIDFRRASYRHFAYCYGGAAGYPVIFAQPIGK
jgi:hypothetical protein